MRVIYLIALILGIAYTGLTLYFEWRLEKQEKEWQRKWWSLMSTFLPTSTQFNPTLIYKNLQKSMIVKVTKVFMFMFCMILVFRFMYS